MTILTTLVNDPVPPVVLLETAPIAAPAPGTQLVTTLQWNNLLDLLRGTSVDEIDRTALEVMTVNRAAVSDVTGHLDVSVTTLAELALLTGLTENVQTSLNAKELSANKGAVSGYAALDASQLLLLANFPAGTGLQVLRRNAGNTALEFGTLTQTLEGLTDTTITAAAANEVLVRNAGNTAWVNELLDNANLASGVFGNITGLGIQSQALDMGAQNVSNVGLLLQKIDNATAIYELEANHTTPAGGQLIGEIRFFDDNSINARTQYAEIAASIVDPTSTTEDGTLVFRVETGGVFDNYILLNDSASAEIAMLKNLNLFDNDISRAGIISFQNVTMNIEGTGASFLNYEVGNGEFHFFRGNAGDAIVSMGGTAPNLSMAMSTSPFMETQGADVASIGALVLGFDGNYFNITGTTNIATISSANWQNGAIIKLKFDGVLTITHGTGSNQVDFADNQNYTTAAGDVLTLVRDFAVWVEVSRSNDNTARTQTLTNKTFALGSNTFSGTFAQFNTAVTDETLAGLGTAQSFTADQTFANLILTGRHQLDKGADIASPAGGILTLGGDGNVFDITGVNTINEILATGWQAGSVVTLQFDGILTVTHNSAGTNDILLGDQTNMTTAAGDVLTLFFNGTDWVEVSRSVVGGGGEVFQWTAAHNAAGFNWEGKVASPITMGQGATDLLTVTFLDDTVDAGMLIGNTDGFISFRNRSAVVGDNEMELLMDSGGATTIQNIMRFQIPLAEDSGTTPVLRMDFQDDAGGATARPLMAWTIGATEYARINPSALWTFNVATIFEDINTINFVGNGNTDLTPGTFAGVALGLAQNEAITWEGAAVGTPNAIGFSGSDAFQIIINNVAQYQFLSAQFDLAGANITATGEYRFDTGTGEIHGIAAGVVVDSPTTTTFEIGGVVKYEMDTSFFDFNGLNIRNLASIRGDLSGTNEILTFSEIASAVNQINFINAITGVGPTMSAEGGDTDIDLNLASKGAGNIIMVEDATAAKKWLTAKAADVAAASSLVIGDGNIIDITGTGTINHIQDSTWQSGSIIVLQFDAAATVSHNAATPPATTSAVLLEGGIDFVAAAGDKLTLYYDLSGDVWRELARSARTNTLGFTMLDAQDIALNTTTGTKIGTGTTQKLGFFNATPVVQQTHVADPTGGATVDAEARTAINSILAQLASLGLQAAA